MKVYTVSLDHHTQYRYGVSENLYRMYLVFFYMYTYMSTERKVDLFRQTCTKLKRNDKNIIQILMCCGVVEQFAQIKKNLGLENVSHQR